MRRVQVVIIGGGLSGLRAATRLQARGLNDHLVLEARDSLGGRILSVPDQRVQPGDKGPRVGAGGGFDLGGTWLWPSLQPDLSDLIAELGLQTHAQHEQGDMLVERSPAAPALRMPGYVSTPAAQRVVGGMQALVQALLARLDAGRVLISQRVCRLALADDWIEVTAHDAQGQERVYQARQVLLALPPRLAMHTIELTPALPPTLVQAWQESATWMAAHAKYLAVYAQPFWRDQGLSGEARSFVGPMGEIHDASPPEGHGALFGFLGVPAAVRGQLSDVELRAHCRAQLVRLFGEAARMPLAEYLKDWSQDPHTAVPADLADAGQGHPSASLPITPATGPWRQRLVGVASEWSPLFGGYLAGAIDAAERGVDALG